METAVKQIATTQIAVTLPSNLYQRVETLASELGLSRDELFRQALSRLLAAYHETEITRQLNEVYAHEDSSVDPVLMQMQMMTLEPEEW